MYMHLLLIVLSITACALVFSMGFHFYFISQTRPQLLACLKTNQLALQSCQVRYLFRGPFTISTMAQVYRINTTDSNGQIRKGYARVGTFWHPETNQIAIAWDDQPGQIQSI